MHTEQDYSTSHIDLQKIISYLLHQPLKNKKINSRLGLKVLGRLLNEYELHWLNQIDPRRWEIDHERGYRTIEGALFHCPVSALCFSSYFYKFMQNDKKSSDPLSYLVKFFESDLFAQCIKEGQFIVNALLLWIKQQISCHNLPSEKLAEVTSKQPLFLLIDLELELIKTRRLQTQNPQAQTQQRPTPITQIDWLDSSQKVSLPSTSVLHLACLGLAESFLALNQEALLLTQKEGRSALLLSKIDLTSLPIQSEKECWILLSSSKTLVQETTVEALSSHLADLLVWVQTQPSLHELKLRLIDSDLEEKEAEELIESWVEDGLILLNF